MCASKKPTKLSLKILSILAAMSLLAIPAPTRAADVTGDAEIIGLLNTINQNEIKAGEIAAKKASTHDVMAYATHMQKAHQTNLDQTLKISEKLGVSADTATDEAIKLRENGIKELMKLSPLDGNQFDRAYIDSMVKDHHEALNTIDQKLIPAARSDDLRQHLTETREHVSNHLQEAQKIQAAL